MAGLERRVAPNLKNTLALPDYSVELTYLGNDKVAKDASYRCKFELVETANPPVAVAANAVIPLADKGKKYRIMVHDNHAAKSTETSPAGLKILGEGADTNSKPACYRTNNWIRDVRPAVGFRVTIKKWAAGVQVTMSPDEVSLLWTVKDPEEELAQVDVCRGPDVPKAFLKEWFKHFKRKTNDDSSKEDDNCSELFGGARSRDGVTKATEVLFKSPFATAGPAALDRFPTPSEAPLSDQYRAARATSAVKPDTATDGKPVGISDVYFYPPPISGDNYIFCFELLSPSKKTIEFLGPDNKRMKKYETGPFTMWRKVVIDMMVTFDNVDLNYIQWDDVKKAYRAAFMEVVDPPAGSIVKYDEAAWKDLIKKYLRGTAGPAGNFGIGLTALEVNAAVFNYATWFLPALSAASMTAQLALPQFNGWAASDLYGKFGKELAKLFLDKAYADKGKTSPRTDVVQDTTPGLYIFLCKSLQVGVGLLGAYTGDREFFMVTRGDATCTFAHEMGHALYLRHAITKFDAAKGVTVDIAHTRGAWLDHDQADAVVCTMSYENDYYGANGVTARAVRPVEWHFCAVCLLKLRFWDTVKMRGNRFFRTAIYSKLKPLTLVNHNFANLADFDLATGSNALLHCVGKQEPTTNNMGGPYKKTISLMTDSQWNSSVSARATFTSPPPAGESFYNFTAAPNQLNPGWANNGETQVQFTVRTTELKSNSVRVRRTP
jgi:hypothetical protein